MYDGALANQGLTADPFTGSPYAFGEGNPISNIEFDGHMLVAAGGGGGCTPGTAGCGSTPPLSSAVIRANSYVAWATLAGSAGVSGSALRSVAAIARSSGAALRTLNQIMLNQHYGIATIPSGLKLEEALTQYRSELTSFSNNFKGSFTNLLEDGAAGNFARGGAAVSVIGGLTSGVAEYAQTRSVGKAVAVGLGDTAGNLIGGALGSAAGAAVTGAELGAVAGPLGMVVGAGVGLAASWLINTGVNGFINNFHGSNPVQAIGNGFVGAGKAIGSSISNAVSDVASWF